jgi:Restriction endonuclease
MCHCTATMVVTNRLFTPAAQKLADVHGVELVDRVRLERLAISSPVSTNVDFSPAAVTGIAFRPVINGTIK